MSIRYLEKDPVAVLTYSVNWTEWLIGSDALSNSVVTVSTITGDPTPITIVTQGYQLLSNVAYAELSGGSSGNTYTVTNTITTEDGNTDARRFRIRVSERYI
jgi:hypothetical protein